MPPDIDGLSSKEAKIRLEKFGPNVLPEKPPPSGLAIFASQLKNPLVYVLVLAGAATVFLKDFSDTAIIGLAVFINTVLGFFQERRAGRALYALKQLIDHKASAIRDGKIRRLSAADLVPGDVVILSQGAKVPADGKLLEANRFFVNEAVLTGESVPVAKDAEGAVLMGTYVASGRGVMEVAKTGEETQIGKIAEAVGEAEEDTPLRRQLKTLSKQLSVLVLGLTLFVFVVGAFSGKDVSELTLTSIALAVSAIPEGLLVGLTVVLAIGMQRILKRRGLVRHLVSAETLGGVTTICVDKTGTLTEGEMKVVEVVGDEAEIAKQVLLANDLDDPLVVAAYEWARRNGKSLPAGLAGKIENGKLKSRHRRLDSLPFSPKERFFASLNKDVGQNTLFVNGAPEYLLAWCDLEKGAKKEILAKIEVLTGQGNRLIGLAKKAVPKTKIEISAKDAKSGLEWVGLLAFTDPVRPGVTNALAKTASAGISLVVITGDYPQTAVSVMKELGIEPLKKEIMTGEALSKTTKDKLAEKVKKIKLFARVSPDQKLKIVEALKENGETVAMMGDGVNDAPALKKADIGIVVGEATDVAKESADLVLLDSNFATIAAAVEEGRGIFENIRKVLLYLMSDSFEEIVAVVLSIVANLPLPVTAAQILWINLVSDGFPNLALTVEPIRPDIMKATPRDGREKIVAPWMRNLILLVSLAGGVIAFSLFAVVYRTTLNLTLARSVAFASLGVNSLVYVFSIKTLKEPFWKSNLFNNRWLIWAVLGGLLLQFAPFVNSLSRGFFGLSVLSFGYWLTVFSAALVMFIMIEVSKFAFRKKLK